MNMDSHKIFQAYVLAKRIDNKQLNEGIAQNVGDFLRGGFDFKKGRKERMDKRTLESYMDRWMEYWYPRFSNKKDIEVDTPKASEIFRRFLDSENWGDEMNQNVDKALDYFKKNHRKIDFKDLEKNAIETLIYGIAGSERVEKEKATKLIPKSPSSTETSDATSEKTPSVSLDDYKKNSETINKSYTKSDSTPTPEAKPAPEPETASEAPEADIYRLKAEITRLKNNNSNWIKAIKRKFGRSVTKPSDLAPSKAVASKAAPKTKKSPLKK